jgi:hypothetical protein
LDGEKYSRISSAIQNHKTNYPLLSRSYGGRGGKFREGDIYEYIINFEDIGYLVEDEIIISKMVYDHFSDDIETACCNKDVQRLIQRDRKDDKTTTAILDPIYGNFEKLAKDYLTKDGQNCKDLDSQ